MKEETTMKKALMAILAVVMVFGVALAKEYEVKKKAGDYDVEVKIDRNPPVVGDNAISIGVKDASGKYVTDADVMVYYSMPAMPGMPAMNYKTGAKLDGNEYKAVMNLSMSGPWNIAVKIKKKGKTSTVKFNVDAH